MSGRPWTPAEQNSLRALYRSRVPLPEIARRLNRTYKSISLKWNEMKALVPESEYATYDDPPLLEGDCLVLSDLEAPFHHAAFTNNCIELCIATGIKKLFLAGDAMHWNSLSAWEPAWVDEEKLGIPEDDYLRIQKHLLGLPPNERDVALADLDAISKPKRAEGQDAATEIRLVRDVFKVLSEVFEEVVFILGNHEGRFIRTLGSPLFPTDMLRLVEAESWRTGPYYWGTVNSGGQKWQIEHPRNAAKYTATKLAAKYQSHVSMGHSHQWRQERDASGRYWAITQGCAVDEKRLAYASQRHNTGEPHALGALILRDGEPYLLHEHSPWDRLARALS